MPWMIAIAKHDCQKLARAVLEKHAENSKRAGLSLAEYLIKARRNSTLPKAPGTLECYFPMAQKKRVIDHRTGRSILEDMYVLGNYFFVRLEPNWFDKRDVPTPWIDKHGKEHGNFFFLKLTTDCWINMVLDADGVADVFCSTPRIKQDDEVSCSYPRIEDVDEKLGWQCGQKEKFGWKGGQKVDEQLQPLIVSNAYVHNQYKCYEDQSGYIPLEHTWKRGQKMRATAGPLVGAVGTFEEELECGRTFARFDILGKDVRVELPKEDLDPIYTEFLRTTKLGVNPSGA